MPAPEVVAAAVARSHHQPTDGADAGPSLVDYAESSRTGDWSLRGALVRFAQPEPARASAVLELIRRTDGALKTHRRRLEATSVPTRPGLGPDLLVAADAGLAIPGDAARVVDARAADLARVLARFPDGEAIVTAYAATERPDEAELEAAALLVVALDLDELGDALAGWAEHRDAPPPVERVDALAATAFRRLGALGVAREDRPPRPPRRSRRSAG